MPTIFTNPKPHPRALRLLRLALQALAALLVSVLVGIAAAPARAWTPPRLDHVVPGADPEVTGIHPAAAGHAAASPASRQAGMAADGARR